MHAYIHTCRAQYIHTYCHTAMHTPIHTNWQAISHTDLHIATNTVGGWLADIYINAACTQAGTHTVSHIRTGRRART